MAAATGPKKKPPMARLSGIFIGVPGLLGFANLVTPDDYGDEPKFKLNTHHTEDQLAALASRIDEKVGDVLYEKFLAEADALKFTPARGGFVKPTGQAWIDGALKDPKEQSSIQLPYIIWSNGADYKDKEGVLKRKTMRASDVNGSPVDLRKAKLGMKSIVQPILVPSIWASALSKNQAAFSFKLQGVRILKLEQYGGNAGGAPTGIDDEDMALMGEGFETEDLSAYAVSDEPKKESAPRQYRDDLDDEIPF